MVSVTAKIVPKEYALLSVNTAGVVAEVAVAEGDFVKEGQLLVQIKGGEQAQAAVAAAEFEIANAQYALDALYEDTDLLAANALKSAEDAEQALEDLDTTELELAQARDAIVNAEDALEELATSDLELARAVEAVARAEQAVEDAETDYRYTTSTGTQAAIDLAYASIVIAEDAVEQAQERFDKVSDKPDSNLTKANAQAALSAAEQNLQNKQANYNTLISPSSTIDQAVAATALETARAQLEDAKENLADLEEGPSELDIALATARLEDAKENLADLEEGPKAGDIALLQARIDSGYRDYEIYKDGPDPDDVAILQARIANGEAQLNAAKAALDDLQLLAPFDGVISDLNIKSNEWVSPGQPVIVLADLDHLQVETTDLGEMDVAKIQVGDAVVVTFDALPDLELAGVVSHIAPKSTEGLSVNYTVIIDLSETNEALRWGMTAFIDIALDR